MTKHKKKGAPVIKLTFLGLAGLTLLVAALLRGKDVALFNPKGVIAGQEHSLTLLVVGILLLIAVPTLFVLYLFAWKYRETNATATYDSQKGNGKLFNFSIWAIPTVFMLVLVSIMWPATYRLAPRKAIAVDTKPLTIKVIALRWKWLFLYPEQNIATVNFVEIPTDTPVEFDITADDAPMSSFWIPHLSGQLYAMTGHTNRLNLMADTIGDYNGRSAEINGAGFASMTFTARAGSSQDFDAWVQSIKNSSNILDDKTYADLLKPSEGNQATFYAKADADLYDAVLSKYGASHDHTEHE